MPRTIIVPPGTKVFQGGRLVGTVPGPVEESAKPAVPEDEDPTGIEGIVSKLKARRQPRPEQAEEPAPRPAQETKPAGAKPAAKKPRKKDEHQDAKPAARPADLKGRVSAPPD